MDEEIIKFLNNINRTSFHTLQSHHNFENEDDFFKYTKTIVFLADKGIIKYESDSTYRLTDLGIEIIENGGWANHKEKERIREVETTLLDGIEKDKKIVEYQLAKQMLKEYPKTKWIARFGALTAAILGLKELIEWIMTLS
ncbi:hypothetical protein [Pseudozobellia sp. WGM2]|uniref:hypothetical protein n=1 Tax=Pseudozobellia sp. WGM2 TaxID=2787625 RepID=UPI001ADF1349|nr:hypothetical protein [Pseudozobellia sp. WGM2]